MVERPFPCKLSSVDNFSVRMMFVRVIALAVALEVGVEAFAPADPLKNHVRSTSSLQMSAALIVQNKGGGHGELGK